LPKKASRRRPGTTSRKSSSRLPARSGVRTDRPVTLPPGRARLATRPVPTGSPITADTIGISAVACFAATTGGVAYVTITSTLSRTNSAAISARFSYRPSAQRYSIATVRPSIQPSSRNRCTKAVTHRFMATDVLVPKNPMVGGFGCCARAASGHVAALPSRVMNSRRFMCGWPPPGKRKCNVPHRSRLQSCVRPVHAVLVDCWPRWSPRTEASSFERDRCPNETAGFSRLRRIDRLCHHASLLSRKLQHWRRGLLSRHSPGLVFLLAQHHRPGDARRLVRQRHGDDQRRPPPTQTAHPRIGFGRFRSQQIGACPIDQQPTQITVVALGDAMTYRMFRTIRWGWRPRIWLNWRWLNATRPARGSAMSDDTPNLLNHVITIDDERIKSHLDRVVRGTVEETLNALLDAEADRLCNAQRYERSEARCDTRAGHYERGLQTKAGEVGLRVPKLRQQTFETAII